MISLIYKSDDGDIFVDDETNEIYLKGRNIYVPPAPVNLYDEINEEELD